MLKLISDCTPLFICMHKQLWAHIGNTNLNYKRHTHHPPLSIFLSVCLLFLFPIIVNNKATVTLTITVNVIANVSGTHHCMSVYFQHTLFASLKKKTCLLQGRIAESFSIFMLKQPHTASLVHNLPAVTRTAAWLLHFTDISLCFLRFLTITVNKQTNKYDHNMSLNSIVETISV